ncbi:hypothetical protein AA313_de0200042 [Arthrobotrys entomopaga]|nr:hypothetical protein AA313_de0200042 [Arthrobotrys entomopaga]
MARISFTNSSHDRTHIPLSIGFGPLDKGLKINSQVNGKWLHGNDTSDFAGGYSIPPDTRDYLDRSEGFNVGEAMYHPNGEWRKVRFLVRYHKGNKTESDGLELDYYWIRFYLGDTDKTLGGYDPTHSTIDYAYFVPKEVKEAGIRSRAIFFDCEVTGPLSEELQVDYVDQDAEF